MKRTIFKFFGLVFFMLSAFALVGCTDNIEVTGIEISSMPTKVEYVEGETFDSTGLEVKKVMSDESKIVITDYTIDKTSALAVTDTQITVSYQSFSATINITVSAAIPTLTDIEFRVEDGYSYVRTTDLSSHIEYREVYSDETVGEWEALNPLDLINYTVSENTLTVTASLYIHNQEWTEQINVPVDEESISVDTLLTKEVDDTVYQVQGILVAIGTTMSRVEFIIYNEETGSFIGVTGISTKGEINQYTLDTNGFEIGDEIIIPVKLERSNVVAQHSDSNKYFARYMGGMNYSTAVVSKNNEYVINKDQATLIDSQEDLIDFLSPSNREAHFNKLVKFHGTMYYIYYESSKHYRFFLDPSITTYANQKIDNCSPTFANGSHFYTTGKTIGELLFNDANYNPTQWSAPGSATKDIYALFIGGNTYYHEFIILEEGDISEVTPVLESTSLVNPTKLAYIVDDTFDITGGKIVRSFDYGDDVEIELTQAMLDVTSLPNMSLAGDYTVTGSYEGFEFSFLVTVSNKSASSVNLSSPLLKTNYHIRGSFADVKAELTQLQLVVNYEGSDSETVAITDNMITTSDEWTIGEHQLTITYLSASTTVLVTVENQGVSVSELKTKEVDDVVYDLHGVVVSSAFVSGTATAPANGEILIKDLANSNVIGLKGLFLTAENKLGGLSAGDEVLVRVKLVVTSTTATHSEYGKITATKEGSEDIIVLSQNNNYMLDLTSATLIASQEHMNAFLLNAETRNQHLYQLVKLSAGAKIVNYSLTTSSAYITFDGTSAGTSEVDGLRPFLHQMNEAMTLGDDTYLNLLFGESGTANTNFEGGNVLSKDVYLMYIGGQGIYYHQFILLGEDYVMSEAAKNLKEVVFTQPTKVNYSPNSTLDYTGGTIEYKYYYAPHNETINLDATLVTSAPIDMSQIGQYTITFTHRGETYEYMIVVNVAALSRIEIDTLPTKTVYSHREGIADVDVTGGKLKLIYDDETFALIDMAKEMLPVEESSLWDLGVVEYQVTYNDKTTVLSITYENQALSVAEFLAQSSGTFDVTGIVVGPYSSFAAAELLIKDANTMDIVGIYNTGVVGAYNAISLDTTVLNVGDEVIVNLVRTNLTSGIHEGKYYGNAVNNATFIENLMVLSTGNPVTYQLTGVVEIDTQQDLIDFLNSPTRFYSVVKFIGLKAVLYSGSYRIFFGTEVTSLTEQKVNTSSPYLAKTNTDWYINDGIDSYFTNTTSTDYANPIITEYEIYAIFGGGNNYYQSFAILNPSWFVLGAS